MELSRPLITGGDLMGTLTARGHKSPPAQQIAPTGRVYVKTILTLAIASRLGVVWLALASFPRNWFFVSAPDLGYLAQSLASGRGLSSPFGGPTGFTALVTPGYPA